MPIRPRLGKQRLEMLVEEAIVDAYNESEQRTAFFTMMAENLELPFETVVLGIKVTIERVDMNVENEIVVICRHGRKRQALPVLEIPLPKRRIGGAEWIEAYRYWKRGR